MKSLPKAALVALTLVALTPTSAAIAKEKGDNLVPAGEPINCISPSRLRNTRVVDGQTIDFYMNNGKIYRNKLPYSCPGLAFEQRFAYKLSTDDLCSVDMITVLESLGGGMRQGATCGLGMFQPMVKAPK